MRNISAQPPALGYGDPFPLHSLNLTPCLQLQIVENGTQEAMTGPVVQLENGTRVRTVVDGTGLRSNEVETATRSSAPLASYAYK